MRVFSVNAWLFSVTPVTGKYQRLTSFGTKVKDGVESVFDVENLSTMVENFGARKNDLALCYDHQSAYVAQNGQPAPALGWFDSLALIVDGELVTFASHSGAEPPDPAGLDNGVYGRLSEITPLGEKLLPNYKFISPMFTDEGADEEGNSIGYDLLDAAVTNTPFQDGVGLTFHKGITAMAETSFRAGDRVKVADLGGKGPAEGVVAATWTGIGKVTIEVSSGPFAGNTTSVSSDRITKMSFSPSGPGGLHEADAEDKKEITKMAMYLKCFACGEEQPYNANGTFQGHQADGKNCPGSGKTQAQTRTLHSKQPGAQRANNTSGAQKMGDDLFKKLGLSDGASADELKGAMSKYMADQEEAAKKLADDADAKKMADADDDAKKMSAEPDEDDKKMSDEKDAAIAKMAKDLGLDEGASASKVFAAYQAKTAPVSDLAKVRQELDALRAEREADKQAELDTQYAKLADRGMGAGYAGKRENLIAFARADLKSATEFVDGLPGAKVFNRFTKGGSPVNAPRSEEVQTHGEINGVKIPVKQGAFAAKARAYAKEHKVSIREAQKAVISDPVCAADFLDE